MELVVDLFSLRAKLITQLLHSEGIIVKEEMVRYAIIETLTKKDTSVRVHTEDKKHYAEIIFNKETELLEITTK